MSIALNITQIGRAFVVATNCVGIGMTYRLATKGAR
jgi:hypothetical protein